MKAHWLYAAGQGKLPWTEISWAITSGNYDWVGKKRLPTNRLPSGEHACLVDPGNMTIDKCIIWFCHLKRRQLADPNTSTYFQFQQAYTSWTHVFPKWTKSTVKKPTRRAHVEVLLVKYEGYLDRPETYNPIHYNDNSWDYFYRNIGKASLVHWTGLPACPKAPIPPQISSSEVEVYHSWFGSIKESQLQVFDQIFSMLKLLNRLDKGIPLIVDDELWRLSRGQPCKIPLAIPQSPPSAATLLKWLALPWIIQYFLAPHEAGKAGTPSVFEGWQYYMQSGPMYHALSKTFRGGRLGTVWVIRGILKHLLNVGAGAGVLKLPKDAPPGLDFTQTTLANWDHATTWLNEWHSLLENTCKSLKLTVRERRKSVVTPMDNDVSQTATKGQTLLDPPDNMSVKLVQTRTSIPCQAKFLVLYVDPYMDLDVDWLEPEESNLSSDSDAEPANLGNAKSSLEQKPPSLLKASAVKKGNYDGHILVFGPYPKAKPVVIDSNQEKIHKGVDTYFQTTSNLFSTYKAMKSYHGLPYTSKLQDWIQEHTLSLEEPRCHLVSTIPLQRLTWCQAQVVWPKAESQYCKFLEAFRQGQALLAAIQAAKDKGAIGPNREDILTREDELTACVWTTCLVFQQFKTFAVLSTQYANKLQDCFLTMALDSSLSELRSIVAVIWDWRQDYLAVTQDLRERCKVTNKDHQLDNFVLQVQNSWFWHGNPSGFVLSAKAEELVHDIPAATEIIYEDKEKQDENPRHSQDHSNKVQTETAMSTVPSSPPGNPQGASAGKGGSSLPGAPTTKMMKQPKPKPRVIPRSSSPPSQPPQLQAGSSAPKTLTTVACTLTPALAQALPLPLPVPPPPSSPQSTPNPLQPAIPMPEPAIQDTPEADGPRIGDDAATECGSAATLPPSPAKQKRTTQGSAPVVELPRVKGKVNEKSTTVKNSKKQKANTEASNVAMHNKGEKEGEKEEGESKLVEEGMEKTVGRPKRKRVQTARAYDLS